MDDPSAVAEKRDIYRHAIAAGTRCYVMSTMIC